MTRRSLGRNGWKQVLASMVVTLSVAPVAVGQDNRGRVLSALLDRLDVDGDGRISEKERQAMRGIRGRARSESFDAEIPESLKALPKASSGPHAITSVTNLTLPVEGRAEPLTFRLSYPRSTGKFPVIIFSHGAFGSKDGYDPIVNHWVSHGYVVLQATHGDSLTLVEKKELVKILSAGNPFDAVNIGDHWRTRVEDVTLLADSLSEIESMHAGVKGKMDHDRIGFGGHSYGGNTTQLVGGLNFGEDLKIDRARALLLLSPPGPSALIRQKAFKKITAPTLVVTGTRDHSARTGQGYQWRLKTYDAIPADEKYLLFIEDAEHNLGGVSGTAGRLSGGGVEISHLTYV